METQTIQLRIKGRVQGVGFRPFVARLAQELGLLGYVENIEGDVLCVARGIAPQLERFRKRVQSDAPAQSEIFSVTLETPSAIDSGNQKLLSNNQFNIVEGDELIANGAYDHSKKQHNFGTAFPLDKAICDVCLSELKDPLSRRARYPFISCCDCGPRYAITNRLPFNRSATSMDEFPLCEECSSEYSDPSNRRYHAQSISCAKCGPHLTLLDSQGRECNANDPLANAALRIKKGELLAIKSTGGFHIVCDARNKETINRLRLIKQRPHKPFAVMLADLDSISDFAKLDESSQQALKSPEAPIVLLPKTRLFAEQDSTISPSCSDIGCMLPYNAIYYLLLDELKTLNDSHACIAVTSANLKGQSLISDSDECIDTFANLVDAFLTHDLAISNPIDDSVIQSGRHPISVRAGRGLAPLVLHASAQPQRSQISATTHLAEKPKNTCNQTIKLPNRQNILAFGAHLKSTICISSDDTFILTPHIGDLDSPGNARRYLSEIERLVECYETESFTCLVSDKHPDYFSSQAAQERASKTIAQYVSVQHHHAHLAAVVAEHGIELPTLGLALDGYGYGPEGEAWGGELMRIDEQGCTHLGSLTPINLPGGEQSAVKPLRAAASVLKGLGHPRLSEFVQQYPELESFLQLLDLQSEKTTTSMGRWFDAMAGLLGFSHSMSFEGQAAMWLEALAVSCDKDLKIEETAFIEEGQLNLYPVIELCLLEARPEIAAKRFHVELANGIARWINSASGQTNTRTVLASGGCIQNRMLRDLVQEQIQGIGYKIIFPVRIPPNDAGISLGQAFVAKQLSRTRRTS